MNKYEILDYGNNVINTIIATAEFVERNYPGRYRLVEDPVIQQLSISPRDLWRRFTVAEREALQNILATGTQTQKNKLNAFRDYIQIGGDVELNDDYIIASINMMETAGIIGTGRAAQILAIE